MVNFGRIQILLSSFSPFVHVLRGKLIFSREKDKAGFLPAGVIHRCRLQQLCCA